MVEEFIKFLEEHEALDYYYKAIHKSPKFDDSYYSPITWLMDCFHWRICPEIDCVVYILNGNIGVFYMDVKNHTLLMKSYKQLKNIKIKQVI